MHINPYQIGTNLYVDSDGSCYHGKECYILDRCKDDHQHYVYEIIVEGKILNANHLELSTNPIEHSFNLWGYYIDD